uniref:probable glutathione S-transferase n=1 Tax=Erigeron canadensis TaxID=72917 RepID=UPI001CB912EF|nr:probable glutathione S-transferase [Erigeron canadensis]
MAAEKREMMLLGYHASPFVNRVRIVLKLKSIEYELVKEDPTRKSGFLLTSNPIYKKVPVLIHGNQPPISESRIIIMEYIDELYPDIHPIFPSLTSNRAYIRTMRRS